MPGRVVVQWDKDDCADMGIVKVDLLGLGHDGGAAGRASGLVEPRRAPGRPRPPPRSPVRTCRPTTRTSTRLLQEADTVGVFQVESRAQMATLPRLRPERFYDLVVEVAIIRPGPIVGQMVHPYLNRRAGARAGRRTRIPSLEPILARTLGVPLFQEQLLRMAMVAAGFTGGAGRGAAPGVRVQAVRAADAADRGAAARGDGAAGHHGRRRPRRSSRSITSFALYGFPESHAASFALLAYASAYLKAHYPAAFYTALLNNQPMGFYHPATLVKDAQRRGVRFAPIDVQASDWDCTVEPDGTVRLGLRYVSGLREQRGQGDRAGVGDLEMQQNARSAPRAARCPKCGSDDPSMIERTSQGGVVACFCNTCAHDWKVSRGRFRSLEDLIARTGINREELSVLAEIGALHAFGCSRRDALWQVERAVRPGGALFTEAQGSGLRARASQGSGRTGPWLRAWRMTRPPARCPRCRRSIA